MEKEYLLRELIMHPEITISEDFINEIKDFRSGIEIHSLESLALKMSGHQPIINYRFDMNKFKKWCIKNNLQFIHIEHERMFRVRMTH